MYTNAYLSMKNGALIVSMPTVTRMFGGNGSNDLPKFVWFFMTKVCNSLLNKDTCRKILILVTTSKFNFTANAIFYLLLFKILSSDFTQNSVVMISNR